VTIENYRDSEGKIVFAANHPAAVPTSACDEIAGVGDIRSSIPPTRLDVPEGGLSSADLVRAYDALPLAQAGFNGQGETVVLFEYEGGFLPSDFKTFDADEGLPPLVPTKVGRNAGFEAETTMDLETVHEIAPQAHLVFFDLSSVTSTSTADQIAQAITDAAGRWPGAILSMSLGLCEADFDGPDLMAMNAAVASAEEKGTTMFAASGDNGGLECTPDADDGRAPENSFAGVQVPASLPAVTGTGGTALTTDAAGNYIGETTWSEPLLSQGSGGGVSAFTRPSWQTGPGTGGQIDTGNGREVPDVSADADPTTGTFIIQNGKDGVGGGTSLSVPIWAGFTAIIDQYLKANHDPAVGFLNPILYHLANSSDPYPPFHDITEGGNDLYLATPGYDMVTGLGSPDVYNLARDLKAGGS
jgi:kumamolisin